MYAPALRGSRGGGGGGGVDPCVVVAILLVLQHTQTHRGKITIGIHTEERQYHMHIYRHKRECGSIICKG